MGCAWGDSTGAVYVADFGNSRIKKILPDGTKSIFYSSLNYPYDVKVDNIGNVAIADSGNKRILLVNPNGSLNRVIYSLGGTCPDSACAYNPSTSIMRVAVHPTDKVVYATDTVNGKLIQFSMETQSNITLLVANDVGPYTYGSPGLVFFDQSLNMYGTAGDSLFKFKQCFSQTSSSTCFVSAACPQSYCMF